MQDSLGGNSKTTIIANVSPSVWYEPALFSFYHTTAKKLHLYLVINIYLHCSSASETLSTLKFAQRAKLIQNNVSALIYMSILVIVTTCIFKNISSNISHLSNRLK